jgi:hypothetical protein
MTCTQCGKHPAYPYDQRRICSYCILSAVGVPTIQPPSCPNPGCKDYLEGSTNPVCADCKKDKCEWKLLPAYGSTVFGCKTCNTSGYLTDIVKLGSITCIGKQQQAAGMPVAAMPVAALPVPPGGPTFPPPPQASPVGTQFTLPPGKYTISSQPMFDVWMRSPSKETDSPRHCTKCSVELCSYLDVYYGTDPNLINTCSKCQRAYR